MIDTPRCVDCQHVATTSNIACTKAKSPLDGAPEKAAKVRADSNRCGPEGKWYEPEGWRTDRESGV